MLGGPTTAFGACGGTLRTWTSGGGNDNWSTTANWSGSNVPDSGSEDAKVIGGARDVQMNSTVTIGCFEIASGLVTDSNNVTVSITGDYFRNLNPNSMTMTRATAVLRMAGSGPQTFENVDNVSTLDIANNTSVTITDSFQITNALRFNNGGAWTGTLYINENLSVSGAAVTIPNGGTVVIGAGGIVNSVVNWTVASGGTLKILPGGQLRLGDGEVLTVNSGGNLRLEGAPGNPAIIASQDFNDTPNVNMNGNLYAEYFQISGLGTNGLNINGVIQKFDNGDLQNPPTNGRHMTLGASTSLPATFSNINFLNGENSTGLKNIVATSYNGTAVTINNWGGSIGGAANETDPNGKINWGTQVGTQLVLADFSNPATTVNQNTSTTAATFALSLNQASTATNITQIRVSMIGTAGTSDISSIQIFRDAAGSRNCAYNAGTDVDMTGAVSLSGSPPSYTLDISPGDISTSSDSDRYCVHVRATTSSTARDGKTLLFAISNTGDVTNSQDYPFSDSASPPISPSISTYIVGDAIRKWEGSSTTAWNTAGNWAGGVPTNATDCEVGVAQRVALVNTTPISCQNANLPSGGTMDWGGTTRVFDIYGDLDVGTGYTFLNTDSGPGVLNLRGAAPQSMDIRTEFPGNVTINNTGTGNNEIVSVNSDSIVGGNLTITNGTLKINAPYSLTVRGNLTCQNGANLTIDPGATLKLGDNSVLDIQAGCTLKIVGTSNSSAVITSDAPTSKYTVNISGTVQAQYYTFSYLGTTGVTVNSGATIDTTYHFQNGTFTYPVNNNSTFLRLARQVPTNTLNNMTFSSGGSSATGTKNIDTTGASAGTLTLDGYTGDLAGVDFDTDPSYLLSWLGAVNTINLTQEATGPTSVDAGSSYQMGVFGFQQTLAGASYENTDLTSVKITLTGTASANDIQSAALYYDSNCDGLGGTLLGSGALSGNPASRTFSISAGQAVVEADADSPPLRCLYVQYTFALGAVDGNTAGVSIQAANDVSNSQGYSISSSTQPPVNLGTAATIVGSNYTNWTGGAGTTAWNTAGNWSGGVPNSSKNCQIDDAAFDPVINGITATCKSLTITNGTLTMTNGSGAVLELYGGFSNSGTFTQNDGTLRIRDDGSSATNQTITSSSTINSMTFNKTAGGDVSVSSTAMTINTLTIPAGSNFTFKIPSGKTLSLTNSLTYAAGTFSIEGGGSLKMANGTTFTVNSGGTLRMVGSTGSIATMTAANPADAFQVVVNGTIQAQHYRFERLGLNGVTIASGASIDGTYQMQNGTFACPKVNDSTLLRLQRQIPTGTLNNMAFELMSCGVTGTKNIDTTGASAGTLTLNTFSGDLSGPTFDTDPSYVLSWVGAQNTIDITATTASGGMNAGTTYNMGRFNFKQTQAGAGFSNADLNSLRVTLTGTAQASDISAVRIYYDSACSGTGGTLIGSGTFSGSPASRTFSLTAGQATVPSDATTPPTRCVYVEYDIAGGAVDGRTAGAELSSSAHVANDQGWAASPSTSFPVSLGTARTISGAAETTWTGTTNTTWTTAGNWTGGVPDSTKNCIINNVTNDPVVTAGTVSCKQMTINSGGSVTVNTGTVLEVLGSLSNSGTFTINGTGNLRIAGTGAQTLTSSSAIPKISFSKTAGSVSVGSTNLQVDSMSFEAGANFTLTVPDTKTLTLTASTTFSQTVTLAVDPGGTVKMANGTTLQFDSPSKLKLVGNSSKRATINSNLTTSSYNVVINTGTIEARYYTFDHLGTNGLTIESGASIDATNRLQDGQFIYPVNSNSTLLRLRRQVPNNTMDNCFFDLNGSAATGTKNIDTTGASAGTLTLNSYSGNLAGPSFDTDPSYVLAWTGAMNNINLTQGATTPTTLNAGSTHNIGRFVFRQTEAGAGYSNTDITSLKLTLTGTASAADIAAIRIYYETDCNSTGGALIGSGTFSGSPISRTFSITAGDATIPAHATSPPNVCIYVEYDIAAGATNGATAGARIVASGDVVTSQGYTISSGTPPPVTLGTPGTIAGSTSTSWTGTVSTDWFNASNWSAGVPDATKNCQITNLANDPNINGGSGTARCKNFVNLDGVVTLQNGTGAVLEVYGNYDNTGTLTQNNGTLRLVESGTATSQNFSSSTTVSALTFTKTLGGGDVRVTSSTTINTLTIPGGSNFDFKVPNGVTLTVTNGVTIPAGTVTVEAGGTLRIPNGQTLSVTGGTFRTTGVNDAWGPQNLTNKGKVTNAGSGTWSFSASSGSVNLVGFILEYLDANGLNLSGSANLVNLDGGQFVNLPNSVGARAIQINKTSGGAISETTPTNVGFMWGAANSTCTAPCTPSSASSYYLVYAPNCGGAMTLNFSEWFGSFTTGTGGGDEVNTEAKIYDSAEAGSCDVVIAAAASPISLSMFEATPFDASVSLDWRTGSELNHQGFNVYRSLNPHTGYIQINQELIRNVLTSTTFQGVYRFVDSSLVNGLTYYYKIEDVAVNGARVMHGPVAATPMSGLGAPPPDSSSTNRGDSEDGADQNNGPGGGAIAQPGLIDLGNGVHILSRTNNSIRLEVVPPPAVWTPSPDLVGYETLSVPGYSKLTEAGQPELVERRILLEVEDQTTVNVTKAQITSAGSSQRLVSPAPSWMLNQSNVLVPQYIVNAQVYAQTAKLPLAQHFSVDPEIKVLGNKRYVEVRVVPHLLTPSTGTVTSLERLILDLSLNGSAAWVPPAPDDVLAASPAAVDGVLRVKYRSSGMYEITFENLADAGVEGPFDGVSIDSIRGYYRGDEIPIRVLSADGQFGSGDRLQFHGFHLPSLEDEFDEVVLASFNVKNSSEPALRMQAIDGSPTGFADSPEESTYAFKSFEQDNMELFDLPLGDFEDRLYWARILRQRGDYSAPHPVGSFLDIPMDLTGLERDLAEPVRLRLFVRGRAGYSYNSTNHLVFYVNSVPFEVGEAVFSSPSPTELFVDIPSNYFFSGVNNLRLQVVADRVPPGDYDIVDVNRVEVRYRAKRMAMNGVGEIYSKYPDSSLRISGFTSGSGITIFDVSRRGHRVSIVNNSQIGSTDGGLTYDVQFAGRKVSDDSGRYYLVVQEGSYKQPEALFLNFGSEMSLKDPRQGADMIVIGSRELLAAADELIQHRRRGGLRVAPVSLQQIYAEFGFGKQSATAIRDFLSHARTYWELPAPKYILLIGDSSYDPKDRLGYGQDPNRIPIPILKGDFIDFGSDHWFVADENNNAQMAIGRLPSSRPIDIETYARKVISYETGEFAPTEGATRSAAFIADLDTFGEGFWAQAQSLEGALKSSSPLFSTKLIQRSLSADQSFKAKIIEEFDRGSLMMTYVGHGASDRWASAGSFTTADAASLRNQRLPIVTALNCQNSYFYDADPANISLGEALIFNPSGGAIAFWGSTGMTVPPVQVKLKTSFLHEFGSVSLSPDEHALVGDLMTRSKSALGTNPSHLDTLRSWTLFGDPALQIPDQAFAEASVENPVQPEPAENHSPAPAREDDRGPFGCGSVKGMGPGAGGGPLSFALEMLMLVLIFLLQKNYDSVRLHLTQESRRIAKARRAGRGFAASASHAIAKSAKSHEFFRNDRWWLIGFSRRRLKIVQV